MSDLLPIFPLPNVVLFPNVFLPLHIFEPRYREMVADALDNDRMIGMVLLKPGWEHDYEGRPRIYPIGCSGVITHADRQTDGRFNIVLRGVERFRVVEEDNSRSYRRALIDPVLERTLEPEDRAILRRQRSKLEALVAPAIERHFEPGGGEANAAAGPVDPMIPSGMADEDLVNALAQYLDLEPVEKQALLERHCLRSRAESLVELLEMKVLIARTPRGSQLAH
ncbi:MAG: LON peptidase substrate-binding domain-containing protein [Acidobacteriota bacterium]